MHNCGVSGGEAYRHGSILCRAYAVSEESVCDSGYRGHGEDSTAGAVLGPLRRQTGSALVVGSWQRDVRALAFSDIDERRTDVVLDRWHALQIAVNGAQVVLGQTRESLPRHR